jgi:hypothetical protein
MPFLELGLAGLPQGQEQYQRWQNLRGDLLAHASVPESVESMKKLTEEHFASKKAAKKVDEPKQEMQGDAQKPEVRPAAGP